MLNVLTKQISAVCPVFGVSIRNKTDKSTWRIDFKPEATPEQRVAAQSIVESFDVSASIEKAVFEQIMELLQNPQTLAKLKALLK